MKIEAKARLQAATGEKPKGETPPVKQTVKKYGVQKKSQVSKPGQAKWLRMQKNRTD